MLLMLLNSISRTTLLLVLLKPMKEMSVQILKVPFALVLIFHVMDRLILNVLDHPNALEGKCFGSDGVDNIQGDDDDDMGSWGKALAHFKLTLCIQGSRMANQ